MNNGYIHVLYVEENQDGTTGGSHGCLLDLVSQLDSKSFTTTVMFYEKNRLIEKFEAAGCKVVIYNKPKPIFVANQQVNNFGFFGRLIAKLYCVAYNNIATSLVPLFYFVYFILSRRIDIVHLNNSVFTFFEWLVAAKITGRKIIAHQRSHFKKISPYLRYHHRYFDFILGMSDFTREYLSENGVDLSRYRTFYDRIDIPEFKKRITKSCRQMRSDLSIETEVPVIGIIGNLQKWKGQITVVGAVALLKDKYPTIKCLLIGDWSEKSQDYVDEIRRLCEAKGLTGNVIITGHRNDIPNLLTVLDIFIHASLHPEPFGMVVLEAMASRKAIIAANEGGPVEMIENGMSGFLIPPGDTRELAEKIDVLLSDDAFRRKIGESAYARMIDRFSSIDINFLEALYRRLQGLPAS